MKRFLVTVCVTLCHLLEGTAAFPCTTFMLQGGGRIYFCHTLDWEWPEGLVIVNQRNIQKTAFLTPGRPLAKWVSKYGSVTFNKFGRELPFGGMNEEGLAIETMWLDATQYPPEDARPEVNLLQWVQYQLDTCRTVEEVIASSRRVRLGRPMTPARNHYLLCDASGDCATVESLDGVLVCHRGLKMPFKVLANDSYEKSVAYVNAHPEALGTIMTPVSARSLPRFACAAARVAGFHSGTREQDLGYAFGALDSVSQGNQTIWRIVYDVSARQIHFLTRDNPQRRS